MKYWGIVGIAVLYCASCTDLVSSPSPTPLAIRVTTERPARDILGPSVSGIAIPPCEFVCAGEVKQGH